MSTAGLQIKSIRQLQEAELPHGNTPTVVGKYIDNNLAQLLSASITSADFNLLSDAGNLSIEASNGSLSFKVALSSYINPIISALIYLKNRLSEYLTLTSAQALYVPWDLNGTNNVISNGTLKILGPDSDSNNTALSIAKNKSFIVENALEVLTDGLVKILNSCNARTLTVDNILSADATNDEHILSVSNLFADTALFTNLTANSLCAGLFTGTTKSYLLSANTTYNYINTKPIYVNGELSSDNISVELNIKALLISATNKLSSPTLEATTVKSTNISGTYISAWNLTAGIAGTVGDYSYSTTIKSSPLMLSSNYITTDNIEAVALCAGIKTYNLTKTVNLKVEEDYAISVNRLSANNLTGGTSNLIVEGSQRINVENLSAHEFRAGNYDTDIPNIYVSQTTMPVQIQALNVTLLTAIGSADHQNIACLTAKAACWS